MWAALTIHHRPHRTQDEDANGDLLSALENKLAANNYQTVINGNKRQTDLVEKNVAQVPFGVVRADHTVFCYRYDDDTYLIEIDPIGSRGQVNIQDALNKVISALKSVQSVEFKPWLEVAEINPEDRIDPVLRGYKGISSELRSKIKDIRLGRSCHHGSNGRREPPLA